MSKRVWPPLSVEHDLATVDRRGDGSSNIRTDIRGLRQSDEVPRMKNTYVSLQTYAAVIVRKSYSRKSSQGCFGVGSDKTCYRCLPSLKITQDRERVTP